MHYPEDNVFYPSDVENCYGWQIQFADGNRMDLHVCTKENALANLELYQILVDKDGIVPYPQETTDERYWVKEPREIEFKCTCSDFWWCLNNVAKGLWRNELPYAMDVINFVLRPHLKRLLEWKMGIENNFSVSAGKSGKYFKKYLPKETYRQFLATYSIAEIESIWNSVFEMCDLFQSTAVELMMKSSASIHRSRHWKMSLSSTREGGCLNVEKPLFSVQKRLPDDDVREILSGGAGFPCFIYSVHQFRLCEIHGRPALQCVSV